MKTLPQHSPTLLGRALLWVAWPVLAAGLSACSQGRAAVPPTAPQGQPALAAEAPKNTPASAPAAAAAKAAESSEKDAKEAKNDKPGTAAKDTKELTLVKLSKESRAGLPLTLVRAKTQPVVLQVSTFVAETKLQDDASVDVVAPAKGVLERLGAATGDLVKRGAVLAVLRSPEVGHARASVRVAVAKHQQAQQRLERAAKLVKAGVGTGREVQEAEAKLAITAAELDEARSHLAALGVGTHVPSTLARLPYVEVRALASGTVLERPVRRGAAVSAGGLLFRVGELSKVWLAARLGEHEAAGLRPGAKAEVRFAAMPDQPFSGEVVRALGLVDVRSRTTELRVRVDDRDGRLRPGMAASVTFTSSGVGNRALVVPQAALQRIDGKDAVFVLQKEGVFEKREVERGRVLGTNVEVRHGLRDGEHVVGEGAFWLRSELARSQTPEEK